MWPVWLLPFLQLLMLFPCYSLQGLQCLNDFVNNVTCVWNSTGVEPDTVCTLFGAHNDVESTCSLRALGTLEQKLRRCHLVFEDDDFGDLTNISIRLMCESSVGPVTRMMLYYEAKKHIKLPAPSLPIIENATIKWTVSKKLFQHLQNVPYDIQLQLRHCDRLWETILLKNKDTSMELPEERLEMGAEYQFRVRILITDRECGGQWSEWSPIASWRATVGMRPPEPPDVAGLKYGIPVLGLFFLVLLIVTIHRSNWPYALKTIPDPSRFFEGKGNFKKWSPTIFAPESFYFSQNPEDISPIELSITKETDILFKKECSRLSEHWDSSGQSSSFSNMGYFCSRHPSSYDPCHVYFSYQPAGGSEDSKLGEEEANGGLLLSGSSYEPLEQHGQPRSPDSEIKEDQQSEAVEEEEESPNDPSTTPCPLAVLRFPPPYGAPPFPHHLPSLLHLPLPFPGLDMATTLSGTFSLEQLENTLCRCSSLSMEPSSGGYMPVKDTRNSC